MRRSSRSSSPGVTTPATVLAVAALAVAIAVSFAVAGGRGASPEPSDAPATPVVTPDPTAPTPVVTPTPATPAPVVTPTPATPAPSPGVDGVEIPLDDANGNGVTLGIADPAGYLEEAVSGDAGDGMSVRWGNAIVRNIDATTIEVTWVSYPQEPFITLVVRAAAGDGILLRFGQAAPPAYSDAMGADRVVVLTFAHPVSAEHVVVDFTTADD